MAETGASDHRVRMQPVPSTPLNEAPWAVLSVGAGMGLRADVRGTLKTVATVRSPRPPWLISWRINPERPASLCCSHPHEALHAPHPLPVLARRDRCRSFDAARSWGAVMSGFILRWSHIADMALRPLGLWLVFTIHMDDSTGRVSVRGLRVERRGIF
ncbi:hypothetical protein V5F44_20270 [Xanthobacter sp. V2C-8]|uniref:hypothetical protein n=1 Tax=Xanthobacter albus TaxID=3119929 RepID=UPI00372C1E12